MKTQFIPLLAATFFLIGCVAEPIGGDDNDNGNGNGNGGGHVIKPNNKTSQALKQDVIAKYNSYKTNFLNPASGGKYYIEATGNGEGGQTAVTISEAHGYGMIIFALMAEHDPQARTYFDGMNALRKAQRSRGNQNLMSWVVYDVNSNGVRVDNSATDGDLDNAYALLLAYRQWGDASYLSDARTLIAAIKGSEMSENTKRTNLGDWTSNQYNTRSSDWMPGHFRAFAEATGDKFWLQAADTVYSLLSRVSNSTTGLIPDFVTGTPPVPDPAGGGTGESNAEHYWYNACRDPWRLALDYAHHQTPAAKAQIDKISSWLRGATGGNVGNIRAGYQLNGTSMTSARNVIFTAPFAAGMIANSDNQTFLNNTYSNIIQESPNNAYAAALQLLCMLLITGNWQAPY